MILNRVKDILKDSSIYGLSKILGQLISFFLIPVYTTYLTPDDYGILSLIGIASASLALLMTFGLDSAAYRYVGMAKDDEGQKTYVANAQILTVSVILLITVLALLNLNRLNTFIVSIDSPSIYLIIGIAISICTTISSIPRAYLRINRKVKIIAISSLINIITSISFTILFLVIIKLGVIGALLGSLIGSLASSAYIMIFVTGLRFSTFSKTVSKELLAYSLPTLPSQIFAFAIPVYSQWSVKELLSIQQLGLYAVGLKFTLPLSAGLGMFQQAYAPYKFEILKTEKNPKKTFSSLMSLFILTIGTFFLLVSFFGGEILKLMTTLSYHSAANYVFYIALIPFTQGLYFMFGTGVEFAKSPIFRPFVSGAGLITVILTNEFLIKKFGVPGAALSISLGWVVMASTLFIYAQTLYKIKYNWLLIIGFSTSVLLICYLLNDDKPYFMSYKIVISFTVMSVFIYLAITKFNLIKILKRKYGIKS